MERIPLFIVIQNIPSVFSDLGIPLIWVHAISDGLMAIAYYLIAWALIYFLRSKEEILYKNTIILFDVFILACGTAYIFDIWSLWYTWDGISESIKIIAAIVALSTAVALIPLIPKIISLPSSSRLETLNQQLTQQIAEIEAAEQQNRQLNA